MVEIVGLEYAEYDNSHKDVANVFHRACRKNGRIVFELEIKLLRLGKGDVRIGAIHNRLIGRNRLVANTRIDNVGNKSLHKLGSNFKADRTRHIQNLHNVLVEIKLGTEDI